MLSEMSIRFHQLQRKPLCQSCFTCSEKLLSVQMTHPGHKHQQLREGLSCEAGPAKRIHGIVTLSVALLSEKPAHHNQRTAPDSQQLEKAHVEQ